MRKRVLSLVLSISAAAVGETSITPKNSGDPELEATFHLSKTDVSSDAVNWAVEKGVTSGTTATTFAPANTCTRGQIVTFLYRAFAA